MGDEEVTKINKRPLFVLRHMYRLKGSMARHYAYWSGVKWVEDCNEAMILSERQHHQLLWFSPFMDGMPYVHYCGVTNAVDVDSLKEWRGIA